MATLLQDIRYAARKLLRNPGFTVIALLALVLGIGANTAIFSVVNSVLLRPLPYEAADRLVWIWDSNPSIGYPRFSSSGPNFEDWQREAQSFDHIAAFTSWSFTLTGEGDPERIQGAIASPTLFSALGIKTVMGRTFTADETRAGNHRVALLSHGLWQRRFGGDANIINRSLTLNGESYMVIGILPADFHIPNQAELWTPLSIEAMKVRRGNHFFGVIARLKWGVSIEQAQAEMNRITANLEQLYPGSNAGWGAEVEPLRDRVVGDIGSVLWILLGAVGFVLLIACANVANLLLARAAARQKEVAIRLALGASRARLVRQFLTESLLLSLAGGALGLLAAVWGVELLVALSPESIPRVEEVGIDARVLAFTVVVSLLTGIIFGLAPALLSSKVDLNESLKEGSRGITSSLRRNRARSVLVISEIALALVLLVGAGLMIKSLLRLTQVNLGFNPENVVTMEISLPQMKYREKSQQVAFYHDLLERVGQLPGVESAAVVSPVPLAGDSVNEFFVEGRDLPAPNQGFNTNFRVCSEGYFRTMGITLLKGRLFDERDNAEAEQVVIINETLARQFWPDEDPLGKRISFSGLDGPWETIVGVVRDTRHLRLDAEAGLEMYSPVSQSPFRFMALVVRSQQDVSSIAGAIRSEVSGLDRDLPVFGVRPMEQIISERLAPRRLYMFLLGSLAAIALLLAAVGIYGVISYSVAQRTHEIGIRMALGASSRDVVRLIVGQGMVLALIGVAAGLVAARLLTHFMQTLLYEVSYTDTATFAAISALLAAVALVACALPARRATKVDPMIALRYE